MTVMDDLDKVIEEVEEVVNNDQSEQPQEPETTDQLISGGEEALVVITDREKFLIEKCVRYYYGPEKNQGASDHELRVLVAKLVTYLDRGILLRGNPLGK